MTAIEPMQPAQRIQEAHGLWELQVARLAAFAEAGAERPRITEASKEERDAFHNWQTVSKECGA